MRIANNFSLTLSARIGAALVVAFGVFCFAPADSCAADAAQAAPSGLSILSVAPPPVVSPASAAEAPKGQNESIGKNVSTMEDEISTNAKKIIKRLDVAGDTTSLADLNSARQTVTRIEAMIELEKRLKELDKLRGERDGMSMSAAPAMLASAIPSSALMPPPSASMISEPEPQKVKMSSNLGQPEISHIYGTGGKYTAVLKLSNGDLKSVKVGDKISDNESVRAITPSSVDVGGKTSYTLRVKNVDMVYSAMR